VFLTIAPIVLVYVARASKRPILEVARSLVDYTRNYEEKFAMAGATQ